jgi:hypothetical protein
MSVLVRKIQENLMKTELKSNLLVELTIQEAAAINGGKHGADDAPGDNRGGGKDDPIGHG